MISGAIEATPPLGHPSQSRLTVTIITLIVLAFVLAGAFVYLESNQRAPLENVLTAQAKAQYINEMQQVIQNQPTLAPDEKASLISAMSEKLQNKK